MFNQVYPQKKRNHGASHNNYFVWNCDLNMATLMFSQVLDPGLKGLKYKNVSQ